jgi:tetratricopeptide (TPR) repeat protein
LSEETALRVLAALLTAGGALLLYLASPGPMGFIVSIAAVSIAAPKLQISTFLFSWPLLAGLAAVSSTLGERFKWCTTVPPLAFLLWSALNREAAIGLFVLGLIVLQRFSERYDRREVGERPKDWRPLGLLTAATTVAFVLSLFVLPGGSSNLENPVRSALLLKQAGVASWASISFPEDTAFFIYAALAGLAVGLGTRRRSLSESVALATFAGLTLVSSYFIIVFVALAAPRLSDFLKLQHEKVSASRPLHPVGMATLISSLTAILIVPLFFDGQGDHPFEGAVQVISEDGLSGPLFNVPEAGGLIGWVLGPGLVPYSDLRPASLAQYQKQAQSGERLSKDTSTAVLNWSLAGELASGNELNDSRFRLKYLDDRALVYARTNATGSGTVLSYIDPFRKPEEYDPMELPSATRELFEFLDHHRPSIRALSLLAQLLIREGREEEALEAYEAALRLNPDDLDTLAELSRLYDAKRMYGLAERSARHALDLGGNDDLDYILARALYGQGRFEEAASWFERVIAADTDNLTALRAIVDIYRRLERPDLALGHRQRLAVVEQSRVERLLAEAERKRRELDFSGAAGAYQLAHEIRPSDTAILWDRVVVLLAERRVEPALNALREMLEHDPANGVAHLTLGSLCAREPDCDPEEAKQHLEMFLELQPEDINAELARKELATLVRQTNRGGKKQ